MWKPLHNTHVMRTCTALLPRCTPTPNARPLGVDAHSPYSLTPPRNQTCCCSIAVDDLVVAKSGLGAFRPVAKASASALAKVPAGIPVEYAGLIGAPCKAAGLLKGLKAGDVVVQSGADTLVGQSVVQMAKAAGITTISIVPSCPDQESVINILQTLGGDIVVPEQYALTWRFTRLLSDVPAPALAINYIASSTPEVPAAGTKPSKLRALVESASPDELTKIKVAMLTAKIASTTVTYGEADAYGDETAAEVSFVCVEICYAREGGSR